MISQEEKNKLIQLIKDSDKDTFCPDNISMTGHGTDVFTLATCVAWDLDGINGHDWQWDKEEVIEAIQEQ